MCVDIYIYMYIQVYLYIYTYICMCVYMVPPQKNYNFSFFAGIYNVFISFWQIFLKELLFFTHCYSSLFWQQYMVGFQGDNINNIITYIIYKYIATNNHLEHLLEKHFLSTLRAMFKNIRKSPQLEHPKTLQHRYINIY